MHGVPTCDNGESNMPMGDLPRSYLVNNLLITTKQEENFDVVLRLFQERPAITKNQVKKFPNQHDGGGAVRTSSRRAPRCRTSHPPAPPPPPSSTGSFVPNSLQKFGSLQPSTIQTEKYGL
jgi:hypothetical protein